MTTDPIGDMLIQMKNAAFAGRKSVELPYSHMKMAVAKILVGEGYLTKAVKRGDPPKARLHMEIAYRGKTSVLTDLRRISKPGMRLYVGAKQIPHVVGGMGTAILSTPKGIMTGRQARQEGVGGELLCEVW